MAKSETLLFMSKLLQKKFAQTLAVIQILASFLTIEAKEIALSFDDVPAAATAYFSSEARTEALIKKLEELKVPPVMIFANPCRGESESSALKQLAKYKLAGHLIANHTCNHPRLDDVGFDAFSSDALKADQLLGDFFEGQKYFRFPYLNEGKEALRDQMRTWLKERAYKNGMVSVDNDDYLVSSKLNEARGKGRDIKYKEVEKVFLDHMLGAVEFYDNLAIETLGYSPKHVILLHERDATVMFIQALVNELRNRGWKIISAAEAFKDPLYLHEPKNTYANNGIIAQVHLEKTGQKKGYFEYEKLETLLHQTLELSH